MIGPYIIVAFCFVVIFLAVYSLKSEKSRLSKKVDEYHDYDNFSDLARSLPEDHPLVQAINLPEEKFVKPAPTREQILEQARIYSQDYATKYSERPFVTADFISQLLVLNNLPPLGKYASSFFQNRKLFARTSMQMPSNFPSARRRIIKVYRYIGPLDSTVAN